MLVSELDYRLINGAYVAQSKMSFQYQGEGKLSGIDYYLKKKDGTPYIAMKDQFVFTGARVSSINRLAENSKVNSTTGITYDGQGRISNLVVKTDNSTSR